jgi:hypothetical protein
VAISRCDKIANATLGPTPLTRINSLNRVFSSLEIKPYSIGQLTGKILAKNPPEVLLEVGGIGYEVLCPMPTFYAMEDKGELTLHTH